MFKESSLPQKITSYWMLGFGLLFLINVLVESILLPILEQDQTPRNDIYFQTWWVAMILWLLFGRIMVSKYFTQKRQDN